MMHPRKSAAITVLSLLVLLGCSTRSVTTGSLLSFDKNKIYLDQVNAVVSQSEGWFALTDKRKQAIENTYKGEVKPNYAYYLEKDVYVYNNEQLEDYLKGLVNRLMGAWEGPSPGELEVIVISDSQFNAYVDELNQLHVTTGLLRSLESEDQIAAVLAHELAHILLRHNDRAALDHKIIQWAGTLKSFLLRNDVAAFLPDTQRVELGYTGFGLLWNDVIVPFRSRADEREADRLGMDLMMRANFNYEQSLAVVAKIAGSAYARSSRLSALESFAGDRMSKYFERQLDRDNDSARDTLVDLAKVRAQQIVEGGFDYAARASASHDGRDERLDFLSTYLSVAHGGGALPPASDTASYQALLDSMNSATNLERDLNAINTLIALAARDTGISNNVSVGIALALSLLDTADRRYDDAIQRLTQLIKNPYSPAEAYLKLIELQLARRNYDAAESTAQLAVKRIGRDFRFLPSQIRIARRLQKTNEAERFAKRCSEYDTVSRWSRVLRYLEHEIKSSNDSYYGACTKTLGYDVFEKEFKDQKRLLPELNKKATEALESWLDKLVK
jgi:predicted Zn-dependent protease